MFVCRDEVDGSVARPLGYHPTACCSTIPPCLSCHQASRLFPLDILSNPLTLTPLFTFQPLPQIQLDAGIEGVGVATIDVAEEATRAVTVGLAYEVCRDRGVITAIKKATEESDDEGKRARFSPPQVAERGVF